MSYTITAILQDHKDKSNLQRVAIRVIYQRMKAYAPTIVKVKSEQFENGKVKDHPQQRNLNMAIKSVVNGVEQRLLERLKFGEKLTKQQFVDVVKNKSEITVKTKLTDFCSHLQEELKGKLSHGRIAHYGVIANKIKDYRPETLVSDITLQWVEGFEKHLRDKGAGKNTVVSKISLLKRIIKLARIKKLLLEDPFENYTNPKGEDNIPTYLTESEIAAFFDMTEKIKKEILKLSGYYFLLSCYTGYRIGDAKAFREEDRVLGDKIVLRATKNGRIVSLPIHSRLRVVLDYIKDKPLLTTEQNVRKHVREICKLIGIKRHIKFHSGRHSFAMLLMTNGFTIDEVAELLGDTKTVAKTYARIHNDSLDKKIMERLG